MYHVVNPYYDASNRSWKIKLAEVGLTLSGWLVPSSSLTLLAAAYMMDSRGLFIVGAIVGLFALTAFVVGREELQDKLRVASGEELADPHLASQLHTMGLMLRQMAPEPRDELRPVWDASVKLALRACEFPGEEAVFDALNDRRATVKKAWLADTARQADAKYGPIPAAEVKLTDSLAEKESA